MPQLTSGRRIGRRLTALTGALLLAATGAVALAAPAQADAHVQISAPSGPLPVGEPFTATVTIPNDALEWRDLSIQAFVSVAGAGATIVDAHALSPIWACELPAGTANCWNLMAAGTPVTIEVTILPATAGEVTTTVTAPNDPGTVTYSDSATTVIGQPAFPFTGFFSPIAATPAVNQVNAGRSIPVKFSLGGDRGLGILAGGSPSSVQTACDGGAVQPIETTTTSNSGLTYDAATDTYTYVWKTDKAWAGSCRTLNVALSDGTVHTASFRFK